MLFNSSSKINYSRCVTTVFLFSPNKFAYICEVLRAMSIADVPLKMLHQQDYLVLLCIVMTVIHYPCWPTLAVSHFRQCIFFVGTVNCCIIS